MLLNIGVLDNTGGQHQTMNPTRRKILITIGTSGTIGTLSTGLGSGSQQPDVILPEPPGCRVAGEVVPFYTFEDCLTELPGPGVPSGLGRAALEALVSLVAAPSVVVVTSLTKFVQQARAIANGEYDSIHQVPGVNEGAGSNRPNSGQVGIVL